MQKWSSYVTHKRLLQQVSIQGQCLLAGNHRVLRLDFVMGDSSLYKRYTYDEKIRSLEKEIKHYQKEIEINSKKLNDLHTDKEGLERFAREEYFMKKPNEDVFIIKNK